MTCWVCSKNKEKKGNGKNSVKKIEQTGKKRYKGTESSVAGSGTRFICTDKKLFDQAPQ